MWGTRRSQDGKGTSTWGDGGGCARGHFPGLSGAILMNPDLFGLHAKTLTVGGGVDGGVSGMTWSERSVEVCLV
jgi:hypothetical protein